MTTTHDSIAEAVSEFCRQPTFFRKPTIEIDPLLLEQLRAESSHGLSMRHRRITERHIAVTRELDGDAAAALAEFSAVPTTRKMGIDEMSQLRARVIVSARNTTRGRAVA